ncbi:MAG: glycosyltransferase [Dehalococcoidia bacterium]
MERLTVLLLVNDLRVGGAERQVVELARGLDRARFRPIVATLYGGQPLEEELRGSGVQPVSLNRRGKLDFGTIRTLARQLRDERVDVIQPFLTPSTFFGLSAALLARTPVRIVTERCGLREHPGLGNAAYRFIEDQLTRYADAAVPNSEAGRRYLMARGIRPEAIRVIYNGISLSRTAVRAEDVRAVRTRLDIPEDAPVAGIVASLQRAKDHETFLRAASLVREAVPNAHFVIVGDGPLRKTLERRADALGLESCIRFTGNISGVAPYIATFDVAVLSSCDHEGCSNALLEEMAIGKPVVATDVGGNSELVVDRETGLIVPARDAGLLARAMAELLANPARAVSMGRAGQRRFEGRFTIERMVQAYESLYTRLWARREAFAATKESVAARKKAESVKR